MSETASSPAAAPDSLAHLGNMMSLVGKTERAALIFLAGDRNGAYSQAERAAEVNRLQGEQPSYRVRPMEVCHNEASYWVPAGLHEAQPSPDSNMRQYTNTLAGMDARAYAIGALELSSETSQALSAFVGRKIGGVGEAVATRLSLLCDLVDAANAQGFPLDAVRLTRGDQALGALLRVMSPTGAFDITRVPHWTPVFCFERPSQTPKLLADQRVASEGLAYHVLEQLQAQASAEPERQFRVDDIMRRLLAAQPSYGGRQFGEARQQVLELLAACVGNGMLRQAGEVPLKAQRLVTADADQMHDLQKVRDFVERAQSDDFREGVDERVASLLQNRQLVRALVAKSIEASRFTDNYSNKSSVEDVRCVESFLRDNPGMTIGMLRDHMVQQGRDRSRAQLRYILDSIENSGRARRESRMGRHGTKWFMAEDNHASD